MAERPRSQSHWRQLAAGVVLAGFAAGPGTATANPARPAAPADSVLAIRIRIGEERTVFALFTLLNIAGYDDENGQDGMHAVRRAIRAAAEGLVPADLRRDVTAYTAAHPIDPWAYTVVAMTTTGPPEFGWSARWTHDLADSGEFGPLQELPALLRRFAAAMPLDSLYAKVQPHYRAAIAASREAVLREVAAVTAYLRTARATAVPGVAAAENRYSIVIPNLLLSHEQAFSFVLDDTLYSIEGPQRRPGYNPHEFVHAVTNRLTYGAEFQALQAPAETLFAVARRTPAGEDLTTRAAFVDECLVRAISLRYARRRGPDSAAKCDAAMLSEYRRGYLLERFFYEELARYEAQREPFTDYYPRLVRRLDPARELRRWKAEHP